MSAYRAGRRQCLGTGPAGGQQRREPLRLALRHGRPQASAAPDRQQKPRGAAEKRRGAGAPQLACLVQAHVYPTGVSIADGRCVISPLIDSNLAPPRHRGVFPVSRMRGFVCRVVSCCIVSQDAWNALVLSSTDETLGHTTATRRLRFAQEVGASPPPSPPSPLLVAPLRPLPSPSPSPPPTISHPLCLACMLSSCRSRSPR